MRDNTADLVVRAGVAHTLGERTLTAFAVRDGAVVAVADRDGEAELLRSWTAAEVIDDRDLVVLPGFVDTHCHLALAARSSFGVPVSQARDLAGVIELIRERAAQTPAGQWIVTAADWHENQLAERRLPTARELDSATADHPVLVLRGGHNAVVNTLGLRLAGIDRDTPDIDRDTDGEPTGRLRDSAMAPVTAILPATPPAVLADGLATTSSRFASHGLTTVRDPAVTPEEWRAYCGIAADGRLAIRSRPMIFTPPAALAGGVDAYLDGLAAQGIVPGAGSGLLRLWGLKFVLDGGAEAAALSQPYANQPGYFGQLLWETADLAAALATCVRRGWPVGTHAYGDRAIAVLLDAIRAVGPIPRGMLVVEHGGLITPAQIAEAVSLGVHITVQHPLVVGLAQASVDFFGRDRTAALFPLRELLDAGAWISAGTDHPIGPLDPLAGVHGMTTRQTPVGILGPEHGISRVEALRLYTLAGAGFLGQPPGLSLGAPADFVAYPVDPLTCPADDLLTLRPVLTTVNGRIASRAGS